MLPAAINGFGIAEPLNQLLAAGTAVRVEHNVSQTMKNHSGLPAVHVHKAWSFSSTDPKGNSQEELRKVKMQLKPVRFSAT